jgi:hypothetical protein
MMCVYAAYPDVVLNFDHLHHLHDCWEVEKKFRIFCCCISLVISVHTVKLSNTAAEKERYQNVLSK